MIEKEGYKDLTYDKVKKMIEDIMFTKDTSKPKHPKERTWRELPEGFDLDFQIQDGYMYSCGDRMQLSTGSGGMRGIIEAMREQGISDFFIAQDIFVADYSESSNGQWHWIGDVKWKKIEKE